MVTKILVTGTKIPKWPEIENSSGITDTQFGGITRDGWDGISGTEWL